MKPLAKKALLTTIILTAGFSFVLLGGPAFARGDSTRLQIIGVVVIGIAVFASTLIWAKGAADSDDSDRGK